MHLKKILCLGTVIAKNGLQLKFLRTLKQDELTKIYKK